MQTPPPIAVGTASPFHFTEEALRAQKPFSWPWYYTIELAPGARTKGEGFTNVALTRELLRRTEVRGRSCIDIGTMECLVTSLLCRRGAGKVVGYDRPEWIKGKVDLVRTALGLDFEWIAGMNLRGLPGALKERGHRAFDIAVFSGVLYHMFDPLAGLAIARGLVRDGGLMIIETAVVLNGDWAMSFNARGRFWMSTNYWLPSVACLDEMFRFLRLEPIDCVYLRATPRLPQAPPVGRLAVVCRALGKFAPEPGDTWLEPDVGRARDYEEFLDWKSLASDRAPVAYDGSRAGLVQRLSGQGIDLWKSVDATTPWKVTDDQVMLALDAEY